MSATDVRRGAPLTAYEVEVLGTVARGMKRKTAVRQLGMPESAVNAHLTRAAVKLGTSDRAGMVGEAIRTGQLRVFRTGLVPDRFNERLSQVLVLIAAGKSNQDIARELHLSEHAVKSRVQFLYLVLGARSRPQAVVLGVRCGALVLVPARPNEAPVSIPASRTPGDLGTGNGSSRASQAASGALRPVPGAIPSGAEVPG